VQQRQNSEQEAVGVLAGESQRRPPIFSLEYLEPRRVVVNERVGVA